MKISSYFDNRIWQTSTGISLHLRFISQELKLSTYNCYFRNIVYIQEDLALQATMHKHLSSWWSEEFGCLRHQNTPPPLLPKKQVWWSGLQMEFIHQKLHCQRSEGNQVKQIILIKMEATIKLEVVLIHQNLHHFDLYEL